MKQLTILISMCIIGISCAAQKNVSLKQWHLKSYLEKRVSAILVALHDSALAGKIKAYKDNNFDTAVYTPAELMARPEQHKIKMAGKNSSEFSNQPVTRAFNPSLDICCMTFISSQAYSAEESYSGTLKGIRIQERLRLPVVTDPLPYATLCYFLWSDIKTLLPRPDIDFLLHYYGLMKYNVNEAVLEDSDTILIYETKIMSPFLETQTLLEQKILDNMVYCQMLPEDNYDYSRLISNYFASFLLCHIADDEDVFLNRSTGRYESKKLINETYDTFKRIEQFPTAYEGEYADMLLYGYIKNFNVSLSGNNSIDSLLFTFSKDLPSTVLPTYSLPWSEVKKRHPYPWMVWFIEDYYKYQLKN